MMGSMSDPAATPIHPELRTMAKFLPRGLSQRSLRVVRQLEGLQLRAQPLLRRLVPAGRRRDVQVVQQNDWSVRVHHPVGASREPLPAVLWIHGGGYVIGSAAQEDALCRRFANELGAVVAAVDYRRAPEHPFPAPLEDCHDALVWLAGLDQVDPGRVAIGGASAGGGLAAALALMARERQQVSPVLQLLSYPMLDDRTVLRHDIDESGFRLWNNRSNDLGWSSYLAAPAGSDGVGAQAAPARCDDLAGLPPAWIGVGTLDLFLDEDLTYAERLTAAGVPVELDVVDGAFHAFDYLAPRSSISREFRASQLRSLAAAFDRTAFDRRTD